MSCTCCVVRTIISYNLWSIFPLFVSQHGAGRTLIPLRMCDNYNFQCYWILCDRPNNAPDMVCGRGQSHRLHALPRRVRSFKKENKKGLDVNWGTQRTWAAELSYKGRERRWVVNCVDTRQWRIADSTTRYYYLFVTASGYSSFTTPPTNLGAFHSREMDKNVFVDPLRIRYSPFHGNK